ncbi:MAG: undecaprenyl diphosphate synthase [Gammaproteobacteria bacterium]|jgi:undecaprenyl diphosphate synthase
MDQSNNIPKHIAIIMDGNGRWATQRGLSRIAGHKSGVTTLRNIVQHSVRRKIKVLTVFAFSSENWKRPPQEVDLLMKLFLTSLRNEVDELHKNNVALTFIGERTGFSKKLVDMINSTEEDTALNSGLQLVIAANYGGRWDITDACKKIVSKACQGELTSSDVDESMITSHLSLYGLPEPDLFIRTGGEQRISNFLLWQCAYSELYFCDVLWPDFNENHFDESMQWYEGRQRRFGRTDEQVKD